jgi:hypothetical protein
MLIELSRKERVSTLQAIATSPENQKYSKYYDYYKGDHFVKSNRYTTDYGKRSFYDVYTRSGIPVFDGNIKEEKVIVQSNWCRTVVDTIADYTRGVNEDIVVTADKGQEELEKVWSDNNINLLTRELAEETGKLGKTFLRLRQREKNGPYEIFYVDAGGVYPILNPITQDMEGVIYFFGISAADARRLYPDVDIKSNSDVYYAEEWTKDNLYKFIDGVQINEVNELLGTVRDGNPYEFIPFYEIKADTEAESDIVDVIPLNDELNMVLTYNHESLKYHAFPIYSPDGSFTGNNLIPEASLAKVEISPRTILNFPAKRIEGAGIPDSVITYIQELKQEISINSGVPLKLLTADMDGNLSGVALQRLMSGVIKKAEMRRVYIKEAYKKLSKDILTRSGLAEVEVDIIFPDIIKIDTNERLDEAIKKQTLGISKETIFEELGYDYEDEEEKRQEEFDNSLEKRMIDEQSNIQSDPARGEKKGTEAKKGDGKGNNQPPKFGK